MPYRANPEPLDVLDAICIAVAWAALMFGALCGFRLYRWERILSGVRVMVYYKGKTAMSARLIDWLTWSLKLDKDKQVQGQIVYHMSGTRIALKRVPPRSHGKTTHKTVAGDPHS